MKPLRASFLFTATMALLSSNPAVQASSENPGPCGQRLENLGYVRARLKNNGTNTALYEAYRGQDEVRLMVDQKTCQIRQIWLDD
jgi:hypothetical protein